MNRVVLLLCRASLVFLLAANAAAVLTRAQQPSRTAGHPQSSFSSEDDKFPGAVPLPNCVRRLLASDRDVVNGLKYEHLSSEQLPADWFTASEQSLGQNNGTFLIVMGATMMRGANINPFWIFRQTVNSCDLLLSVGAHDLEVLKTRTNGLPDIEIAALTAIRYFENEFKFDGHSYREVKRVSAPIGEEIPADVSGFETRRAELPPVKDKSVLTGVEARGWLWRQWWLEKPSRLRVTAHSKEGDVTTTDYFIRKNGERLDVLIHTHMVRVNRELHAGIRIPLVEDEIEVAADVERRWALTSNPDRKPEVPESEDAAPDTYELYFLDEGGGKVDVF
jgi:hypothetical protein